MASTNIVQVTSANAQFASKFYNIISKEEKGNIFFSPISAHAVLAMAYQGAAGETANKFASTLSVPNAKVAAAGYNGVMSALNSVQNVTLHIANKVYVMKNFPLKNNFKTAITESFLSEAESVDFAENIQAAKNINQWVEGKTNNKIKDLITPDFLNSLTRLVLVNAVYFKGNWAHQFRKNDTRTEPFYISNDDKVDCQMMHITEHFNYRKDEQLDAKILEMKYDNHNVSMVIILPNARDGIANLESKLANVDLSTITQNMHSVEVEVSLPKFKIETTMDLKTVLEKMGLGIIFDDDKADFSEVSESAEDLYVSKVIQKAFIEVNEEGAEAAAATDRLPKTDPKIPTDGKDTNKSLLEMGLGIIFDSGADFTEISESPEELYVSKVIQKAFIEVNEEDAEAAAATSVAMTYFGSSRYVQNTITLTFKADHPFIILLQARFDYIYTVPLFYGNIVKPNLQIFMPAFRIIYSKVVKLIPLYDYT